MKLVFPSATGLYIDINSVIQSVILFLILYSIGSCLLLLAAIHRCRNEASTVGNSDCCIQREALQVGEILDCCCIRRFQSCKISCLDSSVSAANQYLMQKKQLELLNVILLVGYLC